MFGEHNYILDGAGNPVQEPDLLKWGTWFESAREERRVAFTQLPHTYVSTVFMAMDHNFLGDGPPILWETMCFENQPDHHGWHRPLDDYSDRYATKEAALKGHADIVARLRADKKD